MIPARFFPDATRRERILLVLVVAAGALRLLLAALLVVGDDEAYYWLWSRHLAWSYPDHPPMIAGIVALSTQVLGDGAFGIRALNVVLASTLPWLTYLAAREIFGREEGAHAGLIVTVIPALAIGTIIASPDVPMAFFWALSLWIGWRALARGGPWWAALGAAVGLGLLSKLTTWGLVLGLAGAALSGGGARRVLRDPWVYVGVAIAAAMFAPVVVWNARNDWFLLYITTHRERWLTPRSIPVNLLAFAGGQVLYYGLLAPPLIAAAAAGLRRMREPGWRYVTWMSLPVLIVMVLAAADARTKPHWTGPVYLAAAVALGALWPQWSRARPLLMKAAAGLTALVTVVAALGLLLPWARAQVSVGIGHYDVLAETVARQVAAQSGPTVILTDRYQAASHIAYRLRERIPVTTFYGAFVVWQQREAWTGRLAVYAQDDPLAPGLDIQAMCKNVRQVDVADLGPNRPIKIFACEDLRFPPGDRPWGGRSP